MTFFWLDIEIRVDHNEGLGTLLNRTRAAFKKIFDDIADFFREEQAAATA